jgi:hypothetical protein
MAELRKTSGCKVVTSMPEFIAKYGVRGVPLLVEKLILEAPPFKGDAALAEALGVVMADLESAVRAEQVRLQSPFGSVVGRLAQIRLMIVCMLTLGCGIVLGVRGGSMSSLRRIMGGGLCSFRRRGSSLVLSGRGPAGHVRSMPVRSHRVSCVLLPLFPRRKVV